MMLNSPLLDCIILILTKLLILFYIFLIAVLSANQKSFRSLKPGIQASAAGLHWLEFTLKEIEMILLSRHVDLPANVKRVIDGPVAGGTFWALASANDCARDGDPVAYGELGFMIRNGDVWMSPVCPGDRKVTWTKLNSVQDAPKFTVGWTDNYEGCSTNMDVHPFLPQFYFVPRNRKGRRFLDRTRSRAWTRTDRWYTPSRR
jgi:hypothetical protein